jgi:hypothetical protein
MSLQGRYIFIRLPLAKYEPHCEYGPMSLLGSVICFFTVLFWVHVLLLTLKSPRQCCNWRLYITEVYHKIAHEPREFLRFCCNSTSLATYIFFLFYLSIISKMHGLKSVWKVLLQSYYILLCLLQRRWPYWMCQRRWTSYYMTTCFINWLIIFMNYIEFVTVGLLLQTNETKSHLKPSRSIVKTIDVIDTTQTLMTILGNAPFILWRARYRSTVRRLFTAVAMQRNNGSDQRFLCGPFR